MRQQEANQFDKGLNLDTNPIAMDNHQLTGALNATMITMNGNELVLLNDMGNGRVDQAQLPEGYVPVGMKEYGGIVYVASYNPLLQKSLIGCFPSPLRNFPQDGNGTAATNFYELVDFITGLDKTTPLDYLFVEKTSQLEVLINDVLRAGDKFLITSTNFGRMDAAIAANLIKVKIVVVDSEGTSVDVTDDLLDYTENTYTNFKKILNLSMPSGLDSINDEDYNIHKNKISGKLSIQEELVLPSFINVDFLAEHLANDTVNITLTPSAWKSDSVLWNETVDNTLYGYRIGIKINNGSWNWHTITTSQGSYTETGIAEDAVMYYEVYPVYEYSYVKAGESLETTVKCSIKSLKKDGVINVGDVGTGKVTFNGLFKYYNDITNNQMSIDYSVQANIQGSPYALSALFIQAYDIEDLMSGGYKAILDRASINYWINGIARSETDPGDVPGWTAVEEPYEFPGTNGDKKLIRVDLGVSNYYGSYTKMIPYKANPDGVDKMFLNKKHYYIGRICSETSKPVNGGEFEKTYTYGPWFAIITSPITNDIYLNLSRSMFPINSLSNLEIFEINWLGNIEEEVIPTNTVPDSTYSNPAGLVDNMLTSVPNNDVNFVATYQTTASGQLKRSFNILTSLDANNLPFDLQFEPEIDIKTPTFSRTVTYDGTESVGGNNLILSTNGLFSENSDDDFWFQTDGSQLILHYNIKSLLFSKLRQNPGSSASGINGYLFEKSFNDLTCLLPLMPRFHNSDNMARLLALINPLKQNSLKTKASLNSGASTIDNTLVENHEYCGLLESTYLKYFINTVSWKDIYFFGLNLKSHSTKVNRWRSRSKKWATFNGAELDRLGADSSSSKLLSWGTISPKIKDNNPGKQNPMFTIWKGNGTDTTRVGVSLTTPRSDDFNNFSVLMMRTETGEYYPINLWIKSNSYMSEAIMKACSSIYISQPDLTVTLKYWSLGTTLSDYVLTNPYSVNVNYSVDFVTDDNTQLTLVNSNFNNYNSSTQTAESGYYFPKFKIKNNSKSSSFSTSLSSPDLSIPNNRLLNDTEPTLGSCAIINDSHGNTVITNAYRFTGNSSKTPINIDTSHNFLFCGYMDDNGNILSSGDPSKAVLVDIDLSDINGITSAGQYTIGSYGVKIAKALKESKIVKKPNLVENYNILVLSKGNCTQITNCNYWLGNIYHSGNLDAYIYVRRKMTDIAPIYDVELINESWAKFTS